MNVFSVPAEGGEAKRLTFYYLDEKPSAFTPDGKAVPFSSTRLGDAFETFALTATSTEADHSFRFEGARWSGVKLDSDDEQGALIFGFAFMLPRKPSGTSPSKCPIWG
jgi:hypothetical protein